MSVLCDIDREENYLASAKAWKDFEDTIIWHDMKFWLEDRIRLFRDELELCGEDKVPAVRGKIAELREFLNLPENMAQVAKADTDRKQEESNNERPSE